MSIRRSRMQGNAECPRLSQVIEQRQLRDLRVRRLCSLQSHELLIHPRDRFRVVEIAQLSLFDYLR